jgi:hypothetical protein
MNEEQVKELLKQALPRMTESESAHDLWPDVLRRMETTAEIRPVSVPWFDWALIAGLAGFVLFVPASIPVILYYL